MSWWLATVLLAALAPDGLPDTPSAAVTAPLDYSGASLEELVARGTLITDELASARVPLGEHPRYHLSDSVYFGAAPFDETVNRSLTTMLRQRQQVLEPVVVPDPRALEPLRDALDQALLMRLACAEGCDERAAAADGARAALAAAQVRGRAASVSTVLETELIGLQLAYLERVREQLRVRERREADAGPTERLHARRTSDQTLPPWAIKERQTRDEVRLAAAEAAAKRDQFLESVGAACQARDQRRARRKTSEDVIASERAALGNTREAGKRQRASVIARNGQVTELLKLVGGDAPVGERFDQLHGEIETAIRTALERRDEARETRDAALAELEDAELTLQKARASVPVTSSTTDDACTAAGRGTSDALAQSQLQAAEALALADEASVTLRTLKLEASELAVTLVGGEVDAERLLLKRVLPHLSPGYRSETFAYGRGFFRGLLENLSWLVLDLGHTSNTG